MTQEVKNRASTTIQVRNRTHSLRKIRRKSSLAERRILMASNADMRGTGAATCSILPPAGRTGNEMLCLREEIHTHKGGSNVLVLLSPVSTETGGFRMIEPGCIVLATCLPGIEDSGCGQKKT